MTKLRRYYFLAFPITLGLLYLLFGKVQPLRGEDYVRIRIAASVPNYDVFKLYYTTDDSAGFSEYRSFQKYILGFEAEQDILFFMPDDIRVTGFRLDVGEDPAQQSIGISKITFSRNNSHTSITPSLIHENEFIEPAGDGKFNLRMVGGKFDPFFVFDSQGIEEYDDVRTETPFRWLLSIILACFITFAIVNFSPPILVKTAVAVALFLLTANYLLHRSRQNRVIQLTVNAVVPRDDNFVLMITNSRSEVFDEAKSVSREVKGSPSEQNIVFEFPDTTTLSRLRLDIGNNPEQEPIILRSIVISGGNTVTINSSDLSDVFIPNSLVRWDTKTGILTPVKPSDENPRYDPFLQTSYLYSFEEYFSRNTQQTVIPFGGSILVAVIVLMGLMFAKATMGPAWIYVAYIFGFFLCLLLPTADSWFGFEVNKVSTEKRRLATKPVFGWPTMVTYPQQYETYYTDNFGFRNVLVLFAGKLKVGFFHASSLPERSFFGKDNWMFYSGEADNVISDIRRTNLLSSPQLQTIAENMGRRMKTLDSMGIAYYKAKWPDKHTIYFDKLPFALTVESKDTISRTDQLVAAYQTVDPPINVIDVRPELMAAKDTVQVYLKNDTHWNEYGAFIAYRGLLKRIAYDIPEVRRPKDANEFVIEWHNDSYGDILSLQGLEREQRLDDEIPTFRYLNHAAGNVEDLPINGYPPLTTFHRNPQSPNKLRVLMFVDSYSQSLIKFISPHFAEVLYLRVFYDQKFVDAYKPDIVVEAFVARVAD